VTSDADDRRRLRRLLGAAGVLAVPLLVVWWPGCREYPAVTSKASLVLMKLLYTACNTKDPARLSQVERGVEKAAGDGRMSPAERQAFADIVRMAKAGDWGRAEAAAFQFAQDQVGRGSADTRGHHDPHDHPRQKKSPKGTAKR
jgi:hypothetical protein